MNTTSTQQMCSITNLLLYVATEKGWRIWSNLAYPSCELAGLCSAVDELPVNLPSGLPSMLQMKTFVVRTGCMHSEGSDFAVYLQNPFDHIYRDHDVEGMSDG